MFTHADIWQAIDALARAHGLTTSGLARKAGLDPTSFNRSKRVTPTGRPRWPSSESLAKVLKCTNTSLEEFAQLMNGKGRRRWRLQLPVQDMAAAHDCAHFSDKGQPRGKAWKRLAVAGIADSAFGLRLQEDLGAFCRKGDILVIMPSARLRTGDNIMCQRRDGALLAGRLKARNARHIVLQPLAAPLEEIRLSSSDCRWMARIYCLLMNPREQD